jgi:hypothetical protein
MRNGIQGVVLQASAVADGNGVVFDLLGTGKSPVSRVGVQVAGITTATVTFEVSNDGVTWYAQDLAASSVMETPVNNATADGFFVGAVCARYFRARISGYSAGTITVTAVGQ